MNPPTRSWRPGSEAAIASASDLPADLQVEANDGVVSITGSLACDDCGGLQTPGGIGTVQQSVGAVVRAVPGVEAVEVRARSRPLADLRRSDCRSHSSPRFEDAGKNPQRHARCRGAPASEGSKRRGYARSPRDGHPPESGSGSALVSPSTTASRSQGAAAGGVTDLAVGRSLRTLPGADPGTWTP